MAIVMRGRIRTGRSKYFNKKIEYEGYLFDSIKEKNRYEELRLAQKSGAISELKVHPKFDLIVNGMKICRMILDFSYTDESGNSVIEDVKSAPTITPIYRIKKKLLKALLGIEIKEIR